jgi:hypothetical protein
MLTARYQETETQVAEERCIPPAMKSVMVRQKFISNASVATKFITTRQLMMMR